MEMCRISFDLFRSVLPFLDDLADVHHYRHLLCLDGMYERMDGRLDKVFIAK